MVYSALALSRRQRARALALEGTDGRPALPAILKLSECATLLGWRYRRAYNVFVGEPETPKRARTIFFQHDGAWFVRIADLRRECPKFGEEITVRLIPSILPKARVLGMRPANDVYAAE
jgi:hypothetical protein